MNWGTEKQSHYRAGRELREVEKSQIEAACACGYLTLKPGSEFEERNGGLTIKRSNVRIMDNGREVKRLRIRRWGQCNACVNDWK